ncbi:helix-turn-helix domain-containing protein [Saliphagus infecundisoli]|uniref:Helix-turn-helix domain-containing protein n=1 Tax=Saliphagus infecundisoli TaxID=1849069 RepID=A0ABD5QLA1_9EURY|nr:helix-turn-helix domain-containing protein [Saliphagus infecundisoli]
MTTVAQLVVPTEDVMLSETFAALPELDVRVKTVAADGPHQTMPLVWITGASKRQIRNALSDDSSIKEFTSLLEHDASEWLYRLEYTADLEALFSAVFTNNGTILDAECSADAWTFHLLFSDRGLLSEAIPQLEDHGLQIEITRMIGADRNTDLGAMTLTEAQENAIREAYERGYYDVPRQLSLEELAAELDVSHQALSERLRRANKVLASEQFDKLESDGLVQ